VNPCVILFAALLTPLAAMPGGSANYRLTPAIVDGGGLRGASASYTASFSAGPGGAGGTASYTARGGFAGQLGIVFPTATGVELSAADIAENSPAGSTVGTLTVTDPPAGATFTYALASGAGDTDNTAFTLTGNVLSINNPPDFETQASYTIRVRVTEVGGSFFEKSFTLTVSNMNEAPIASVATYTRAPGTSLKIRIATLLAAATSDPEGDVLTMQSVGASIQGTPISFSPPWILYSPVNNHDDSFDYTISDGHGHTATGTISVKVVSPAGASVGFVLNGNGQPVIQFAGIPGYRYTIERATTDLENWADLHTFTAPVNGVFTFTDPTLPPLPTAFYRMRHTPAP
jgi:hypothetical protein